MNNKIIKGFNLDKSLESGSAVPSFIPQSGVVRKEELQANTKAGKIIEEAQREAEKIKLEAQKLLAKVEKEMEEAKKRGLEEGRAEGVETFTQKIFELKDLREKFLAEAEPEVTKLVLAIAEKVIGDLAIRQKEAITTIIRQAIERSLGDRIVVRLHPDDWKRIKEEEKEFKERLDKTKHLYFKEDDTIQPGGCVVETEIGTIDAQLETQLKAIRKALGV